MSQENVEIVRAGFEAFNSLGLEGALAFYAPEIEWRDRDDDPDAGVHHGHQGVREAFAQLDAFAELRVEPEELIDAGDCVVVQVRVSGYGRASDAPFDDREVHVFRLRDRKIIELREYREMSEALKAVGLAE